MRFGSNTIKHSFFKIRDGLFGGRIARTTYIIRVAILGGVLAILAIPIGTILSTSPQTLQDAYMVLALGMLALCLIGFICTYVRRLHDIGLSGFWALPALLGLPPLIFFLSTEYASYRNGQDPYDDLSAFLNLSLFAALLLPLMIALWRGQANANRFGPVPEAVESLSSSKVSMAALLGAAAILIPTSIYIGLFQEGVWVGRGRYPPSMPMIDSNTKGHRLAKCWNLKGVGAGTGTGVMSGIYRDGYSRSVFDFVVLEDGELDVISTGETISHSYRTDGFHILTYGLNKSDGQINKGDKERFTVVAVYNGGGVPNGTINFTTFSFAKTGEGWPEWQMVMATGLNPEHDPFAKRPVQGRGRLMIGDCVVD